MVQRTGETEPEPLPTEKVRLFSSEGRKVGRWVVNGFYIHKLIQALAADILAAHGKDGEDAMLFPSHCTAKRCIECMLGRESDIKPFEVGIVDLILDPKATSDVLKKAAPSISAVIFPQKYFPVAKQYWQHSGDGVSSRRAEFCHRLLQEGLLVNKASIKPETADLADFHKGPRRYRRCGSIEKTHTPKAACTAPPKTPDEDQESYQFVEERFDRKVNVKFLDNAKSAIRRRIAGSLQGDTDLATGFTASMDESARGVPGLAEDGVYLYPCGMNAIFNAHQFFLEARGPLKSICFGFPYVDTLEILEKFGPGVQFYGNGASEDLDGLENRPKSGKRFLALFLEFPGNPLLKSPDLQRIRKLSLLYDFGVVIDKTVCNFVNVHVLPFGNIIVSSLTKIFTGECNVMGGSGIFNPTGPYYPKLKTVAAAQYEDNYWAEDVLFMERNGRDFVSRIHRINQNAEAICSVLLAHPLVKSLFYPSVVPSRPFYDACRTPNGGYGGLLSVVVHTHTQAVAVFDRIDTAKGHSLGTNFTLTSPYVILADFGELEWAGAFGVDADLVGISVGCEEMEHLKSAFEQGLKAADEAEAEA